MSQPVPGRQQRWSGAGALRDSPQHLARTVDADVLRAEVAELFVQLDEHEAMPAVARARLFEQAHEVIVGALEVVDRG
jgi:hypothetical protein